MASTCCLTTSLNSEACARVRVIATTRSSSRSLIWLSNATIGASCVVAPSGMRLRSRRAFIALSRYFIGEALSRLGATGAVTGVAVVEVAVVSGRAASVMAAPFVVNGEVGARTGDWGSHHRATVWQAYGRV